MLTVPVLTLPASDTATAIVADWLIRTAAPLVLTEAGLDSAATRLERLAPITARSVAAPRRLHRYERRTRAAAAAAQRELRMVCSEAELRSGTPVVGVPEEVMNTAARISGDLVDLGSDAAAYANRAVLAAYAVVAHAGGDHAALATTHFLRESYCTMLTQLWRCDARAHVRSADIG